MDEREPAEQVTGPADAEAEKDVRVAFTQAEARLVTLAAKYREHGLRRPELVTPEERADFADAWEVQADHWQPAYSDFVDIMNDITSWVDMRYKGVPDLMTAAAVMAAGQHLMGLVSLRQAKRQQDSDGAADMLRELTEKLGLAAAKPGGHG
jgi:hypothetical protein